MKKHLGRKLGSTSVTNEERESILLDYKAGVTLKRMVAKYKRSKSTIVKIARKAGLGKRDQHEVRKQSQALTADEGKAESKAKKTHGHGHGKKAKKSAKTKTDSIARANAALAGASNGSAAIRRAVAAFIKSLEGEDLLEITVDLGAKTYTLYRIQFEDGSV